MIYKILLIIFLCNSTNKELLYTRFSSSGDISINMANIIPAFYTFYNINDDDNLPGTASTVRLKRGKILWKPIERKA